MQKSTQIIITGAILAVLLSVLFFGLKKNFIDTDTPLPIQTNTVSNGIVTISYPEKFGVATTKDQILVKSYIPSCDDGFDYCVYYKGEVYGSTNFESAGLSIRKRSDLSSLNTCLQTSPEGYTNLSPKVLKKNSYEMSVFAPIGDAAAGHYANGEVYRIYTEGQCVQFDIRIGETQFLNYPVGSKVEFTMADRLNMMSTLRSLITGMVLVRTGETLVLP